MIKLSEWARRNNLSYTSAYNMFKNGKLPVKAQQLETGTILVQEQGKTSCKVVEEASGRCFNLELDLDLNDLGLRGEDQRELLDAFGLLADKIAVKLGYAGRINKLWMP
jgi:hypothetical protein